MRYTAFFGAGLGLLFLQTHAFRVIDTLSHLVRWVLRLDHDPQLPGAIPSLVLPLVVFMGVHEYALARGAAVAFALGYLTDLVGIAPIGLYTFGAVALFVLARAAGLRLAAQTPLMQAVLAFVFAGIHGVILLVLLAIFGRDAWVPRSLVVALPFHAAATALVAPFVFRLAFRIHGATSTATRPLEGGAP